MTFQSPAGQPPTRTPARDLPDAPAAPPPGGNAPARQEFVRRAGGAGPAAGADPTGEASGASPTRRTAGADPKHGASDAPPTHPTAATDATGRTSGASPTRRASGASPTRRTAGADPARAASGTPPILRARGLTASSNRGRIFAPVDLDLYPGQLCMVSGPQGSGKSALLLALAARFRPATGVLDICGIDAIANPYPAMRVTSVAQLGNFVRPEDRLTLTESITERCFLDAYPRREAERRVSQMEEILGYRVNRGAELEQLTPLERALASVALAMLRPARVIVVDDADHLVPHSQQPTLFSMMQQLTALDDAAIVASVADGDYVAPGAVRVELTSQRPASVQDLRTVRLIANPPSPDGTTDQPDAPAHLIAASDQGATQS